MKCDTRCLLNCQILADEVPRAVSGYCRTLADEVRHKMSVKLSDTG